MTIHCCAQLLISTTVDSAPSYCQGGTIGEVIKEGWCGGHQLESERRGRFRHSFGGLGDHLALGHWVSWKSQEIDWVLPPVVLQSPH